MGHPQGAAARRSAGFDAYVSQRVQAQAVVNHGLSQKLIPEVVGEMAVVTTVDVALQVLNAVHLEIVLKGHLPKGFDAQFLGFLLPVLLAVVR